MRRRRCSTAPPIFTQVSVPSTLTKPAPYAAQELADVAPLHRQHLAGGCGLSDFGGAGLFGQRGNCRRQQQGMRTRTRIFASRLLSPGAPHSKLADELEPTDLPRRQTTSQCRPVRASRENASRNLAGSELGSSIVTFAPVAGHVLHHALPRRKAAFERDPAGLTQRFARLALLVVSARPCRNSPDPSLTPSGFKNRCEYRPFPGDRIADGREMAQKGVFGRLARPAKRHYTFARRRLDGT